MKTKRINQLAEELRIRYKYRKLLVAGKVRISYLDAVKLVGQDSAYRLLSLIHDDNEKKKKGK